MHNFIKTSLLFLLWHLEVENGAAFNVTKCLSISEKEGLRLHCPVTHLIIVTRTHFGKRMRNSGGFCSMPTPADTDCFYATDKLVNASSSCSTFSTCKIDNAGLTPDVACPGNYKGEDYVHLTFECLPRAESGRDIKFISIEKEYRIQIPGSIVYLMSLLYGEWANLKPTACQFHFPERSHFKFQIYDFTLLSSAENGDCSCKIVVSAGQYRDYVCSKTDWNFQEVTWTAEEFHSSVTMTLHTGKGQVKGRLWISFQATSETGKPVKQLSVECGEHLIVADIIAEDTSTQPYSSMVMSVPVTPDRPSSVSVTSGRASSVSANPVTSESHPTTAIHPLDKDHLSSYITARDIGLHIPVNTTDILTTPAVKTTPEFNNSPRTQPNRGITDFVIILIAAAIAGFAVLIIMIAVAALIRRKRRRRPKSGSEVVILAWGNTDDARSSSSSIRPESLQYEREISSISVHSDKRSSSHGPGTSADIYEDIPLNNNQSSSAGGATNLAYQEYANVNTEKAVVGNGFALYARPNKPKLGATSSVPFSVNAEYDRSKTIEHTLVDEDEVYGYARTLPY